MQQEAGEFKASTSGEQYLIGSKKHAEHGQVESNPGEHQEGEQNHQQHVDTKHVSYAGALVFVHADQYQGHFDQSRFVPISEQTTQGRHGEG